MKSTLAKHAKLAKEGEELIMDENEIGRIVVELAVRIHRELGPGLLESVYELILAHALRERGLGAERQVSIAINNRGMAFEEVFRADIVVETEVIIEIK